MKNYTTIENATKLGLTVSDYWQKELNSKTKEVEPFKEFCKIVPLIYYSIYDGKNHFEHITVFIEFEGVLLRPSKYHNQTSFIFFLAESLHVQNFNHELTQPNRIGKPTYKKLKEWLTYLQAVENLKLQKTNERQNKEKAFFQKVENAGLTITHQSNNGKRGYITTDLLEFSYEVTNDGYINQRIRIRETENIDTFLKLIQNAKN